MDDKKQNPASSISAPPNDESGRPITHTVDDFFQNLKSEMRRPKPSAEAVAAARLAIERLEMQSAGSDLMAGRPAEPVLSVPGACRLCGRDNPPENQFCGGCGVPLELASAGQVVAPGANVTAGHQYHHHYHHHFLSGGAEGGLASLLGAGGVPRRETGQVSASTPAMSRSEAGIRKLTQDWAQACNTRHLDDLVDFYSTDALVLRSNYPPVRGTSAIREFFVHLLEGGLGDVEVEPIRIFVGADVAYEAGRCKMLAPTAAGKRREERAKYVMIYGRQSTGEWKSVVDCWSSDLTLGVNAESDPARPINPAAPGAKPLPRRTA